MIPDFDLDLSPTANRNVTHNSTLQVQLPALRPSLVCEAIPQDDLRFVVVRSVTYSKSISILRADKLRGSDKELAELLFTYPKLTCCGYEAESWHDDFNDEETREPCSKKAALVVTVFSKAIPGNIIGRWFDRLTYESVDDPLNEPDFSDLFGTFDNRSTNCPHNSAIFGKVANGSRELFGITCEFKMEASTAKLNYSLPDLAIKSYEVIEGSVKSYPSSGDDDGLISLDGVFGDLMLMRFTGLTTQPQEPDSEDFAIDPLIMAALNDPHPESLLTFGDASEVAARLAFIYNNFYTQCLSEAARVPLEEVLSVNATIINHNHYRVVQNELSTRLLQCWLMAMTALALVAFYYSNTKNLLTKNPCSINAQAGFFADSGMLRLVREEIDEKGVTDHTCFERPFC